MTNYNDIRSEWKSRYVDEKICKIYNGSLFHYTTRENLWNIINSNSFYARHLRFSNDSAEYTIGKEEIEQYLDGKKLSDPDDCYMVCFCKKDNILSQWREYARGGVSMEFNFQNDTYYTIKCNAKTERENKNERGLREKSPYLVPQEYFSDHQIDYNVVYARPIAVIYINPGHNEIEKSVEKIKRMVKQQGQQMQEYGFLRQLLPYIKHKGFAEEQEVRLVFSVVEEIAPRMVDYLDNEGKMKPYIRVQVGDAEKAQSEECIIRLFNIPKELKKDIQSHLNKGCLEINFGEEKRKIKIKINIEKIKRAKKDGGHIYIGNCKYQEYVFQMIDHYVTSYNAESDRNINIWCDGYLPIRGITVGPSVDAQDLYESISHKIRNIYWLKYVNVQISDIPYRPSNFVY